MHEYEKMFQSVVYVKVHKNYIRQIMWSYILFIIISYYEIV